jgi:hypothetical protein
MSSLNRASQQSGLLALKGRGREDRVVAGWIATDLDDIAAEQWPSWAPIRHHFGIEAFGVNVWRGGRCDEVIERHDESASGHEELHLVLRGRVPFTIGSEDVDAAVEMCVFVSDASLERSAVAREPNTVVLSIGSKPGVAYEGGWDTRYLES